MTLTLDRVLVVVAHPDDEVLGCGATLHKLVSQGKQVRILIMGEGSSCRFPIEELNSQEVIETITQRQSFADAAMKVLGINDVVYGSLPCGRFDDQPIIDIGKTIEHHIAEFQPETLITHFGKDNNSDHRHTFDAVGAATRPVTGMPVKTVLSMETLTATEWRFVDAFSPNFFVDVTDHMDAKIKAFDCYFETEGKPFPYPRCGEGLETLAKFRGMQVGLNRAEAFHIVRSIANC